MKGQRGYAQFQGESRAERPSRNDAELHGALQATVGTLLMSFAGYNGKEIR